MKILCVISARGGSKGLPGKNIREINGKPLIAWSIEQALSVPEISKVAVSSDSEEIMTIAKNYGADVPFVRPKELSGSSVGKFDVWKHALNNCEKIYKENYDVYLDLDCTNPLRDSSDISKAIEMFKDEYEDGIDAVFSVCEARKNPYFNLVEEDNDGSLKMSKSKDNYIIRRQDAPKVFEHVASIYVLSSKYIKNATHLLDGHTKGYDIGQSKSYDIDSNHDFDIVEFLMKKKNV